MGERQYRLTISIEADGVERTIQQDIPVLRTDAMAESLTALRALMAMVWVVNNNQEWKTALNESH